MADAAEFPRGIRSKILRGFLGAPTALFSSKENDPNFSKKFGSGQRA